MPTVEQRALMSIASELKQIRKLMEDLSDNVEKTTHQARKIVDEYESLKRFAENHGKDDIHE